jgi:hypothetical protein
MSSRPENSDAYERGALLSEPKHYERGSVKEYKISPGDNCLRRQRPSTRSVGWKLLVT